MPRRRDLRRMLHLATVLATTSATSIRPNWIYERDDTCAPDFKKCSQAGLPDNFCCGPGTNCIVLAANTTVLCCPEGSTCETINSITCNITLQDPTQNPGAEIKTTALDVKLETCDDGCCPFGYRCDGGDCVLDDDQTKKPGDPQTPSPSSSDPASTTASSSSDSTKTAIGGVGSAAPVTDSPGESSASATMNTTAIVGGVIGGIVALVLIIGGVMLLRYRRKQNAKKRIDSTSSFGNVGGNIGGNMISAPMPHTDYQNQRLDFLAKAQSSSVATTPTQAQERFGPHSPYMPYYSGRPDSEMSDAPRSYHPSAEVGGLRSLTGSVRNPFDRFSSGSVPQTPRESRQHSGGSESINIFADPSTVDSARRDTTWTDIQWNADRVPDSPVRRR